MFICTRASPQNFREKRGQTTQTSAREIAQPEWERAHARTCLVVWSRVAEVLRRCGPMFEIIHKFCGALRRFAEKFPNPENNNEFKIFGA